MATFALETNLFRAAEAAMEAKTAPALVAVLSPAFVAIGFAYFSIVEAVRDGERFLLRPLLDQRNAAWVAAYDAEGLAADDLRIRQAVRSPGPFFCSEVLRSDPGVTAAERRVFDLARPFGILESYVLPHRAVDRRLYTVVLSGVGAPIDARLRVAANLLASALLMAACRIEAATVAATAGTRAGLLRPRQLECLEWSRRGKSSSDIGEILGLSPRTVDEHIAAAAKALDVRTRVQAVSQALAMGLLPYDPAEARSRSNP